MAETFDNLYCVGPGSIGPGTNVTRSILDPKRNRGTITKMYRNDSGITTDQLAGLYTLSASTYPGTTIALDSTYIRQISDKLALVVARYGSSSSSTGFRQVFDMAPNGQRSRRVYNLTPEYLAKPANRDESGKPKPIIVPQGIVVIRWSNVVYQDVRPTSRNNLIGAYNLNPYNINGYSFGVGTLRFEGQRITHQKWGAYDRWILNYVVSHDPTGWYDQNIEYNAVSDTWTRTDDTFAGEPGLLVQFPNMP